MIGQLIGSYKVVRQLGAGGMGAVFEAVHEQIGRRAAIKLLHAHLAKDPQIAIRFLNEARAANAVEHPGIVQIFEASQLPDGSPYIVMEFLRGEALSARTRRGRLAAADTLRLGRQVASVLAAAHERRIVHRDLKPDNVMIVADPEAPGGERVKVVDFGIAKVAEEYQGAGEHVRTQTGMLLGTPVYMSPEQCRGVGVSDRTDVYALGVMLYEMTTGKPPFLSQGAGELMAMHMMTPPQPVRALAPDVPEGLGRLVSDMLAKDPAARPSMAHVAAELERLGAPGSIARGPGLPEAGGAAPPPTNPAGPGQLSTLGQAAAQAGTGTGARRAAGWPLLLVGATALAGLGGLWIGRGGKPRQGGEEAGVGADVSVPREQRAARQPAQKVRWSLRSVPEGAQVVRLSDGQVLGTTPFVQEQERGSGELAVILKRPRYADRPLALNRGADEDRVVHLEALRGAGPRPRGAVAASAAPLGQRTQEREAPEPAALQAGQVWDGHYVCAQGQTRLVLRVLSGDADAVSAVFDFHHPPTGAHGKFQLRGSLDAASRRLSLRPGAWIDRPENYNTVGMEGRLSSDGMTLVGRITDPACTSFVLHRAR